MILKKELQYKGNFNLYIKSNGMVGKSTSSCTRNMQNLIRKTAYRNVKSIHIASTNSNGKVHTKIEKEYLINSSAKGISELQSAFQ